MADIKKFLERVKVLPTSNQIMMLSEKIKYQQTVLHEYFEEIEYQNELNDRFLGMMSHMQKEFISSQHDSEEELREFKRQLSIKV